MSDPFLLRCGAIAPEVFGLTLVGSHGVITLFLHLNFSLHAHRCINHLVDELDLGHLYHLLDFLEQGDLSSHHYGNLLQHYNWDLGRVLRHNRHVYQWFKTLNLRNICRLLFCMDGRCLALIHNWHTHNFVNVSDLWNLLCFLCSLRRG